jgi:hypothetical protein
MTSDGDDEADSSAELDDRAHLDSDKVGCCRFGGHPPKLLAPSGETLGGYPLPSAERYLITEIGSVNQGAVETAIGSLAGKVSRNASSRRASRSGKTVSSAPPSPSPGLASMRTIDATLAMTRPLSAIESAYPRDWGLTIPVYQRIPRISSSTWPRGHERQKYQGVLMGPSVSLPRGRLPCKFSAVAEVGRYPRQAARSAERGAGERRTPCRSRSEPGTPRSLRAAPVGVLWCETVTPCGRGVGDGLRVLGKRAGSG